MLRIAVILFKISSQINYYCKICRKKTVSFELISVKCL